jgi:hypothetical protein
METDYGGGQGPTWTPQPVLKRIRNSQVRLVNANVFTVHNFWRDKNQISTWTGQDTVRYGGSTQVSGSSKTTTSHIMFEPERGSYIFLYSTKNRGHYLHYT